MKSTSLSSNTESFIASLGKNVREQVLGSAVTNFAIGGPFQYLVELESIDNAAQILSAIHNEALVWRVLGAGSNLLVNDDGLSECILRLGRGLRYWNDLGSGRVEVGGAMPLISLSHDVSKQGLSGLEFAGGIPATLGGALRMNAGAHGSDMATILETVTIVTASGKIEELKTSELNYSYRHSEIPERGIVLKATLKLTPGDKDKILAERARHLAARKEAQPITLPSAGSVFKNPGGSDSAGILIEKCNLKGTVVGGAMISEKHGNWIVNHAGKASAQDVMACISLCQDAVNKEFNIKLEPEIIFW